MNLRYWLRHNLWRRGLRWLGPRAARRLFGGLLLPALLPRNPLVTPETEAATGVATDARAVRAEREVRVLGSERVQLAPGYTDWLAQLPPGAALEELKAAAERLAGDTPDGQYFFPVDAYLDALRHSRGLAVELTHRCRATRQPASELLRALTTQASPPAADLTAEPAALLVYLRPARAATDAGS